MPISYSCCSNGSISYHPGIP